LDFACGEGCHSLAAAQLGHEVVALDRDRHRLERGREQALRVGVSIDWRELDLEGEWPDLGTFEAVLVFNYLDRASMPRILQLVAPGGLLIMETFLEGQRGAGWGPTSDHHLLRPGELARLVVPLKIVHGREAVEPVETGQWRAVASIVAKKQ
jgi:2-polyprenyl-3-methyl-5-hydroxy-6-metoxy-1,4-benzoquinol methylase